MKPTCILCEYVFLFSALNVCPVNVLLFILLVVKYFPLLSQAPLKAAQLPTVTVELHTPVTATFKEGEGTGAHS